jgi:pimeloyl-ACP methyl ester carboxylesterase
MKFFLCVLFVFPTLLHAQGDWGAFTQKLDVKNFAGKKFRLEAAVKVKPIDSTCEAEIWARVDKQDNKVGFFYNMMDKPIRTHDWKIFTINGKVDKDAAYLNFGGLFSRSGMFYFDNFRLFIETTNDKFEEVKISNGDFENDTLQGWRPMQRMPGFSVLLTKETPYSGQQCVVVDGSKLKRATTFGDNDSTGKYALVNGIKIYYEEYGTGEPLLLLHGNRGSIKAFGFQIPELSKHYHVIAVDSRGQGKSTEDGKTYTYDLFAEDMNALLNSLHIDSANVLGWSDGGNTGLIIAMKYPRKVKKLVTMGANVFIDNTVVDKWVFAALDKQLKEFRGDTTYKGQNRIRFVNLLLTEPKHTFAELHSITCPVLVMAGEKDVIKENHTREIAKNIPNGTLLIAPKETHEFPTDNPDAFNKTVLDYFGKN